MELIRLGLIWIKEKNKTTEQNDTNNQENFKSASSTHLGNAIGALVGLIILLGILIFLWDNLGNSIGDILSYLTPGRPRVELILFGICGI